jgi:hypothetical protein
MVQQQVIGIGASLNPDDASQGGVYDAVLVLKSGRFEHTQFKSGDKALQFKVVYSREDGSDFEWGYNVGGADRWKPSDDKLSAVAIDPLTGQAREDGKFSINSAFMTFVKELVNAGFPQNRLTTKVDCMFGVQFLSYAHKPSGTGFDGQERSDILAAKQVLGLPGEAAVGVGVGAGIGAAAVSVPTMPVPTMPTVPNASAPVPPAAPTIPAMPVQAPPTIPASSNGVAAAGDIGSLALAAAQKLGSSFTKQQVMAQCMQDYASHPNRDTVAGYAFNPEFDAVLVGAGYTVAGMNVSV